MPCYEPVVIGWFERRDRCGEQDNCPEKDPFRDTCGGSASEQAHRWGMPFPGIRVRRRKVREAADRMVGCSAHSGDTNRPGTTHNGFWDLTLYPSFWGRVIGSPFLALAARVGDTPAWLRIRAWKLP
jgi:hypothetical protein